MTKNKNTLWETQGRSFCADMSLGKMGEDNVNALLTRIYGEKNVKDISNTEEGIKWDMDTLVIDGDREIRIEIKTDTMAHRTGNIPFERYSHKNDGCLWRTKSDYVLFYLQHSGEIIVYDTKEFQDYAKTLSEDSLRWAGQGARVWLIKRGLLAAKGIQKTVLDIKGTYDSLFEIPCTIAA